MSYLKSMATNKAKSQEYSNGQDRVVHVGGLDMYTDEDQRASYETELTELFGEFGTVRAAQVRVRQGGWTDGVQKHSWALVTFSLASEAQAAIADAALRLAQRVPSSTHRLQGATKLGALQRTTSTIACICVGCSRA